jgi:hypothetical protein
MVLGISRGHRVASCCRDGPQGISSIVGHGTGLPNPWSVRSRRCVLLRTCRDSGLLSTTPLPALNSAATGREPYSAGRSPDASAASGSAQHEPGTGTAGPVAPGAEAARDRRRRPTRPVSVAQTTSAASRSNPPAMLSVLATPNATTPASSSSGAPQQAAQAPTAARRLGGRAGTSGRRRMIPPPPSRPCLQSRQATTTDDLAAADPQAATAVGRCLRRTRP